MIKRVTKRESKYARKFAENLLNIMRKNLRDKYIFSHRLVGSAVWNTILKKDKDYWDVDYQILLTKNSNEYKKNKLSNPTIIKNDFFNFLNKYYKNKKNYKIENSTTAITLINKENKYSIDFVIIKLYPENNEIIRRNNKYKSSINEYTWNNLPKINEAYIKIKEFTNKEKIDLIENYVLPRKIKEKNKSDNDFSKKSSSEIFMEEVNNYVIRKKHH